MGHSTELTARVDSVLNSRDYIHKIRVGFILSNKTSLLEITVDKGQINKTAVVKTTCLQLSHLHSLLWYCSGN